MKIITFSNPHEELVVKKNFPNISDEGYKLTSKKDNSYNCIAWTLGINDLWIWPDRTDGSYWPDDIKKENNQESFIELFSLYDYKICKNDKLEKGFKKAALYCDDNGTPKHGARQLKSGKWTSKLGNFFDIEHNTLKALEGDSYGSAWLIFKKIVQSKAD